VTSLSPGRDAKVKPVSADDPLLPYLDAATNGDGRALAALVRETQPTVWRLCRALGSPGEEEDLVQETYLRVVRGLPSFRRESPALPWILSIARRVCADHVRKRVRQRRIAERVQLHVATQPVSTNDDGRDEGALYVEDVLDSLSSDRREAFVVTQLLGLSYAEAAIVLDCPIGTIRSRVARARRDLMQAVESSQAR
jgi:RNA polymerase sigma-70 factor (ECF subfamily)